MKNVIIAIALVAAAALAVYTLRGTQAPQSSSPAAADTSNSQAESAAAPAVTETEPATVPASLISTSPEGAAVFIMEPGDGMTVSSPVTIKFGITNMQVAPAGENIENSGHHHLLINVDELPDMSLPLPATDQIIHFGAGQTETTMEFKPGTYTLQLLLGNYLHIPHDKPVISKKITITVE